MKLCSRCRNMQFSPPGEWIEPGGELRTLKIYFRRLLSAEEFANTIFYIHHRTLRELLESSQRGCHGCMLIWHFAFEPCRDSLDLDVEHPIILFYKLKSGENGFTGWIPLNGSKLGICRGGKEYPSLRFLILSGRITEAFQINVCGARNHLKALNLAKQWLARCFVLDPQCFQEVIPPMPQRLIDVGPADGSQEPRLATIESYPVAARYLTLSHCWGDGKIPTTTYENIEQRMLEIPFPSLTKTFQDAIVVTREFGMRYLWIDSLCIIQDSKKDWETQSRVMGAIYSNALFTIAASRSSTSASGLFPVVDPILLTPCHLPSLSFSRSGETHIINLLKDERTMTDKPKGPLYSRAWVLQEEILSHATLAFTDEGMFWICSGCTTNVADPEGGRMVHDTHGSSSLPLRDTIMAYKQLRQPKITPQDIEFAPPSARHRVLFTSGGYNLVVNDEKREQLYQEWAEMIEIFYRRNITFPTDRLPALAGIVPNFQPLIYDRLRKKNSFYVGGLWTDDVERSLLWATGSDQWLREHLNDDEISNQQSVLTGRRMKIRPPNLYSAPSFSWASMHECSITWNGLNTKDWNDGPEAKKWVEFVSYSISAQSDWNVRLDYGSITLRCYLKRIEILNGELVYGLSKQRVRIGRCVFDNGGDAESTGDGKSEIYLLPLRNEPIIHFEQVNLYCLMVSRTNLGEKEAEGIIQFRRLGLAYVKYPNWFGDCRSTLVELV